MGILDKLISKQEEQHHRYGADTSDMFIGSPEAESEATNTPIKLSEFFEDYLNIFQPLNEEKFIIVGRKGSGKTAVGEAIYNLSQSSPNVFCKFIKKTDIDVEYIVQIGQENGYTIKVSLLYKWLMLTHMLDLLTQNEKLTNHPAMNHLRKFVNRNRGFIDIRKGEVVEMMRKSGFSVGVEYLNRALTAMGSKEITVKESKPDFTKLLPGLEMVVLDLMQHDTDNQYIIIFDDLDVGYSTKVQSNIDTMAELLRMVRYFNVDCLGRRNIDSKVLVLLRDDIEKSVLFTADMGKIFNAYAVELNWYEDCYRYDEKNLMLRQFINKRIKVNFQKKGYVINNQSDPWTSFVDEQSFYGGKTGVKYILDYTFFRPRDLILFFKDINTMKLPLPLSSDTIKKNLLGRYAVAMVKDLKGELSLANDKDAVEKVFKTLRNFSNRDPFTYDDLYDALKTQRISEDDIPELIESLFEYSLIGNFESGNVLFKFREGAVENLEINKEMNFILHYLLQAYYKFN